MNNTSINFFGDSVSFHHIGFAVRRIADVNPALQIFEDPVQRVKVAFEELHGVLFEYVEPMGIGSPVDQFINLKQSIYHTCFEVGDLQTSINHARSKGMYLLRRPRPAIAFDGRCIAWLAHPHLGLFELLER